MGGHVFTCPNCAHSHFAWHSCHHRNCPSCGNQENADWVQARLKQRLPLPYFMVTFTLPELFRKFCRYKPRAFYNLFFQCSAQALKDILGDPKHLGIEPGFFGVLQTWQQNLLLHPHIHFVVAGGGLDAKGVFRKVKKHDWLVRGDVLAKRLKTLLLNALKAQGQYLKGSEMTQMWKTKWNADVEHFGNGENAIKYLGRYVQKSAIGDSRILSVSDTAITIGVLNRESAKQETVTLDPLEFVRRYLLHVLPSGFHRIRYFGFMHPQGQKKLQALRELLYGNAHSPATKNQPAQPQQPPRCPHCQTPLSFHARVPRAPPNQRTLPIIWQAKTPPGIAA